MTDIFVDPIIVAAPSAYAGAAVIVEYLDKLYRWLEEALNSPHHWFYSNEAAAKLLECGQYPSSELLQRWVQMHGEAIDVNIRLISRWVNQFFNPETNLESVLEQEGYLIEPEIASIVIQPELFVVRWHYLIRDEMYPLLAKTGACKHMGALFADKLSIATLAFESDKKEISVSAKIVASEPDFTWSDDSLFTQMFPLLFTPDDLPPPTDIITLWDEGEQGMRYAIDRWYKNDWQSSTVEPLKYSFRPSFFESITNYEIDTDTLVLMRIVRAAAAVIAEKAKDIKSYNLRQLRESKTADSKQRTRSEDNAKAWRLTITPDGVGWRMHYWHVSTSEGSAIEFANILKKHDPEEIY